MQDVFWKLTNKFTTFVAVTNKVYTKLIKCWKLHGDAAWIARRQVVDLYNSSKLIWATTPLQKIFCVFSQHISMNILQPHPNSAKFVGSAFSLLWYNIRCRLHSQNSIYWIINIDLLFSLCHIFFSKQSKGLQCALKNTKCNISNRQSALCKQPNF